MKAVIMQPTYLPWLGYFDLIANADIFVFLDHVQFARRSWQQKNRLRDKNGEIILTVSVSHDKKRDDERICDVKIDITQKSITKHLKSIEANYRKSRNFHEIFGEIENIYTKNHQFLADLNIDLIKFGCKKLNLGQDFIFSSELNVSGSKVDALIDICQKVGATHYLSPVGSKNYIDENNIFPENGITLSYQEYLHPIYSQINYSDFISHLSFIDYLFNRDS